MDRYEQVRFAWRRRRQDAMEFRIRAAHAGMGFVQEIPKNDFIDRYGRGTQKIGHRQLLGNVTVDKLLLRDSKVEDRPLALRLEAHFGQELAIVLQASPFGRYDLIGYVHCAAPMGRPQF
jgi:hypothetical protein